MQGAWTPSGVRCSFTRYTRLTVTVPAVRDSAACRSWSREGKDDEAHCAAGADRGTMLLALATAPPPAPRAARRLRRRGAARPARRDRRARHRPPRARGHAGAGERGAKAQVRVEAILSGAQAAALRREGIDLAPKQVDGQTVAAARDRAGRRGLRGLPHATAAPAACKEEFEQVAARQPAGSPSWSASARRVNGQDIVALKVTKNARKRRDGKKPSVLYLGAQHAREWITPEMIRRLMHHFLDGYDATTADPPAASTRTSCGSCRSPTRTATTSPSSPASGCGARTCATTTATARSPPATASTSTATSPTKWGYDNEGSSPDPAERDLPRHRARTPSPRRRRSTRSSRRVGFEFFVNYHSAAELLLYGTGWQVATPDARTTSSTRRWPATTRTRPSRATTRTSRPSSTRPTATPTRT